MKDTDIPEFAPKDAVMASQAEIQEVIDWADAAFGGISPSISGNRIPLEVIRQDFNTLHFRQSCMETPIKIEKKEFKRGLGTHANSELKVTLPSGSKQFNSFIGIDNNYDTKGVLGSVLFIVEIDAKEVFRSSILKGGDAPVPVSINIPSGASELTLKVDTTDDGPSCDQADWADAQLVMTDGSIRWLDEGYSDNLLRNTDRPFSFLYGGVPSSEFINTWKHTVKRTEESEFIKYLVKWADPKTGLIITADVKVFKEYPAIDWVLYLENNGLNDTPIIEDIKTVDLQLNSGNEKNPIVLHQLHGDSCGEMSFLPYDTTLESGKNITIAPARGRPSQETAFPFWNMQYSDRGIITAIGWSGQWSAQYDHIGSGPTRFRAGMEKTHLLLHPGEKIRTPRILMMTWNGSRQDAHNRFRRLMMFQYVPKQNGRPHRLPVALQPFDRYWKTKGWSTEAGQLKAVEAAHELGCDTYWFDAAWFVKEFPTGAGNWFHKPDDFPRGLKPVSDLCHKYGMQFILWFEPCRVVEDTQIANEYPQYVFGGKKGGLFKLNDPEAREWLTNLISKRITEYGIDVYREDYNIDPLDFWRSNDTPNRQGMTEIRFVEGHYEYWDRLRAEHPGLWIDNCASGGRRIDLETCMRSIPLWRSDTCCWAGHPEWNQMQSGALSQYLPLHTACGWDTEYYIFRSSATGGALCQFAYQDENFPIDKAKAIIQEVKENQKYWYGDFYQLTQVTTSMDQFMAYQFHRADLDEGLVLAFRRAECNVRGIVADINGIDPSAKYKLEFIDDSAKKVVKTMTGKQMLESGLVISIPGKGQSMVIRYMKVK
ncbi:MAG: NPCBM/NEW2 domain-containing protein [Armatimonadota bacterium]